MIRYRLAGLPHAYDVGHVSERVALAARARDNGLRGAIGLARLPERYPYTFGAALGVSSLARRGNGRDGSQRATGA